LSGPGPLPVPARFNDILLPEARAKIPRRGVLIRMNVAKQSHC
jgi:hypothetical protein